ncbi:MAG: histidine--tRNA ligase [Chloroherpetonaceae bacterium]|nr:histidine--tRNA ligase [Chloroherpetonaceae bacterium]MDW8437838.1 histidine--tRNA ligase [Chloroherpetonaceae bacterium]
MKFQSVTGTKDLLPSESFLWQRIENVARSVFERFGYAEIRTPVFEDTNLFLRGIGETTDIVGKEMYTFKPSPDSDESLTLRPEMTASVMRAYLQHGLGGQFPVVKVYYIAELFRKERPQKGRYRQFWQLGAECIGSALPESDAEMIAMMMMIYDELGVTNATLKLNSLGDAETRTRYRAALRDYLRPHYERLDAVSKERFEKNPLRILDSKNPDLQEIIAGAPRILDYLDEESNAHFEAVRTYLDELGIAYSIDHRLVRGLDYYSRTAFELVSADLGAQDALGGGGRYDGLAEQLGSPKPIPAVGFASGIERLWLAMERANLLRNIPQKKPDVMLVAQSTKAQTWIMKTANEWRRKGLVVEVDLLRRSLKAQMREANRLGAKFAVIAGESELQTRKFQLKNLRSSEQTEVEEERLFDAIKAQVVESL